VAYEIHKPAPPLSAFVEYLWWLSDKPAHAYERIMASGTQELVINLHENSFDIRSAAGDGHARRFSGAMVSGAYSSYFVIDTRAHVSLLGVHFKPGSAWPVLGIPPGELADMHADLDALWGKAARELRERLGNIVKRGDRFRVLEEWLQTRLARPCRRHPAVPVAASNLACGAASVGQVAKDLGLSRRRLIELFTAEVGMTPKLFGRVQRFQRALALARSTSCSWAEVAPQVGYCDQSHLVRDFVSFSGFAPTLLVANLKPQLKENHSTHPAR
jgi:AraC-like DNA-binding protein